MPDMDDHLLLLLLMRFIVDRDQLVYHDGLAAFAGDCPDYMTTEEWSEFQRLAQATLEAA